MIHWSPNPFCLDFCTSFKAKKNRKALWFFAVLTNDQADSGDVRWDVRLDRTYAYPEYWLVYTALTANKRYYEHIKPTCHMIERWKKFRVENTQLCSLPAHNTTEHAFFFCKNCRLHTPHHWLPSQTLEENPANQFVYKIRSSNKSFGECPAGIQGKADNKFQAKEYTRETSVQCKYNIHCSLQ